MKIMNSKSSTLLAAGVLLLTLAMSQAQQTFTWGTTTTPSSWTDQLNWTTGTLPTTVLDTADFSTLDLTADTTVTLDGNQNINTLIFGDITTGTAGSWIVNTGVVAGVTLNFGGTSPTLTVNALGTGKVAAFNASITESATLTKTGAGTLQLNFAPIFTNSLGININGGTINLNGPSAASMFGTNGTITFNGGTLSSVINTANTTVLRNHIAVPAGQTGTINLGNRMQMGDNVTTFQLTGAGTLTLNAQTTVSRNDIYMDFSPFTGNINFIGSGGVRLFINGGKFGGGVGSAAVDVGGSVTLQPQSNSGGNTINVGALSGSSATAALGGGSAGSPNWTVGGLNTNTTFAGVIQGNSRLTKTGTGTLTLTANHTFTGTNRVNAGTLVGVTGGSISNTVAFIVASGATNGVRVVSANGQWTTTNLTYSAGATCLELTLGGSPSTNTAPLNVLGALTADSTVSVIVNAGNVIAGKTYPLVTYGSLGGTGYAAFSLAATGPHFTGHLVDNPGSLRIDLVVDTVTQPLRWATGSADWDINTTANWVDTTSASTTYREAGGLGDATVFEDAASGTAPITVNFPVTVSPASVTVSNDVKDYNFSGPGRISSAATLSKLGTNTLTMSLTNNYTGGSTLGGGTVTLATFGAGSTGLGTGSVVLTNDATLVLWSGDGGDPGLSFAATFANPLNVPIGQSGAVWNAARGTLTGPLTGGGTLNFRVNGIRGDVNANWSAFAGQINITAKNVGDEFRVNNSSGYGRVNIGDNVNFHQIFNPPNSSPFTTTQPIGELSGTSLARLGGNPVGGRFVNWMVGSLNTSSTFAGTIANDAGAARLTKIGTGTLTLSGTSTHTGSTVVSNGTLQVDGAIDSSPVTNLSGSTLAGTGTLGAAVDLEPGSKVSPGGTNVGTLTFNGSLTFNGCTNVVSINNSTRDLIVANGGLSIVAGVVQVNASETLADGTYTLIQYSAFTGGTVADLGLTGFSQAGQVASLVDSGTGIDLVVEPLGSAALVWSTLGATNNWWDVVDSKNWNGSGIKTNFHHGDRVTFNALGGTNSPVELREVVLPTTVTVAGASNYVFQSTNGAGKISGSASLTKTLLGTLTINTPNDNSGPTLISGGTVRVGNGANDGSIGTGVITNNAVLIFAQTNSQSLNNISGTGSLTQDGTATLTLAGTYAYTGATTIGSNATLHVGTGGATGPLGPGAVTLNGTLIMNQSGTLSLTNNLPGAGNFVKAGTSTLTVSGSNTYLGNTYINNGVLKLAAAEKIPDGGATTGWLILDGGASTAGTLDLNGFNESVNALSGLGGTVVGLITNSAVSGTNRLTVGDDVATTSYSGLISENAAGAKVALVKRGLGELKLVSANTYSAGTLITGGKLTLRNGLAAGTNTITITNGGTLNMTNTPGNNSIFVGNDIITLPGATATTASDAIGSGYSGSFFGSANSTNLVAGAVSCSAGGVKQFQNFTGLVEIISDGELRWSSSSALNNGGDNTTFRITGTGGMYARNAGLVSLGALEGDGFLYGASTGGTATWTIGLKGTNATFTGTLSGSGGSVNNIVKSGAGTQTFSGPLTYSGFTTISNGVLAIAGTAELTNTSQVNIRSGATLNVTGSSSGGLNLGALKVQTMTAAGTILGKLNVAAGSTVTVGDGIATLTVSSNITFGGTLNLELNKTNAQTSDKVVATGGTITGGGTLNVQNIGPALQVGDTFQLFSTNAAGFSSVNLATIDDHGAVYTWTNKIAINGTIQVIGITERIWAVTTGNELLSFGSTAPGTILSAGTITGLQSGETVMGIDFQTNTLYAVGDHSRLYTINRTTRAATVVGAFTPVLSGLNFGMEVEPDGVRVVSELDQNLVLDFTTGAATEGTVINGTPDPTIAGMAYHPGTGVRYVIDSVADTLGTLDPATGLVTTLGGLSGNDISRRNGFDISPGTNHTAYLASPAGSSGTAANLYKILSLATGGSELVGLIGDGDPGYIIRGLAIGPDFSATPTTPGVNPNPTNITFSASSSTLNLSWPASHIGWILQFQTNSRAIGLKTNWVDVAGSASVTATNFPINKADPTVFYRLRKP